MGLDWENDIGQTMTLEEYIRLCIREDRDQEVILLMAFLLPEDKPFYREVWEQERKKKKESGKTLPRVTPHQFPEIKTIEAREWKFLASPEEIARNANDWDWWTTFFSSRPRIQGK